MLLVVKIILLTIVFLASMAIGFFISNRFSTRVRELEDIISALEIFETKISYTYDSLIDTFMYISENLKTKIYRIFFISAEHLRENKNMSAGDVFRNVVDEEKIFLELKDKDIEILKGLSVSLGQTDLENQIKNIRLVQQMLMTQLKDATEEKSRSYKMYRNMGVLTGLILIILLI